MEGRPTDDAELFARAQRGETAAYEEIVQRYQQLAFRTAYVITGSASDAEDAAQEAWTVWSLALSPNGNNLYAVSDGGMIAEMSMTGAHEASTFAGGTGQPMALIRVQAAQVP